MISPAGDIMIPPLTSARRPALIFERIGNRSRAESRPRPAIRRRAAVICSSIGLAGCSCLSSSAISANFSLCSSVQRRQSLRAEASVLAFSDCLGLAIVAIFYPNGLPFCAGDPSTECSLSIILWRSTEGDLAKKSLNFGFKRLIPMQFAVFALALLGGATHQVEIVIVTALSDQPHSGAADALGNAAEQISQSCALASTYSVVITHYCLSIRLSEDEQCRGLPEAAR